jgi:hypothetical protein
MPTAVTAAPGRGQELAAELERASGRSPSPAWPEAARAEPLDLVTVEPQQPYLQPAAARVVGEDHDVGGGPDRHPRAGAGPALDAGDADGTPAQAHHTE